MAAPEFQSPLLINMEKLGSIIWTFKHFRYVGWAALNMPRWCAAIIDPHALNWIDFRNAYADEVDAILKDPGRLDKAEHETIYHHLLNPHLRKSGAKMPTRKSLVQEAELLLTAGSETVANCSFHAVYFITHTDGVCETLLAELMKAFPEKDTPIALEQVEKLPYLVRTFRWCPLNIY